MSFISSIAAVQNNGAQAPAVNPPGAEYLLLALVALVLTLVVVIFIQTSAGRSFETLGYPIYNRQSQL